MKKTSQTDKPTSIKAPSRIKYGVLASLVVLVSLWLGAGAVLIYQNISDDKGTVTSRKTVADDGNAKKTPAEVTISGAFEKASPSVVSVLTEVVSGTSVYGASVQDGAGSGVIVSGDGYVLTNKHVVDDARTVSVVLADGKSYDDVKVVASDPLNDLAYLKIPDVKNLPTAELGDSTTVRVGQQVIAIGNSLGQYQNTVTSGIISGTGRPVAAQKGNSVENLTDLLQTDAAINPGNSGGALLNTSGQVIGINTAIAADAEGIGFAIPINAAKGILKQVLESGSAKRAYLGVRYIPVNAEVARKFDLDISRGAYVYADNGQSAVVNGSPADKAGIKSGDVITKIGNVEVGSSGGVASLIAEYAPGDTVKITVNRSGESKTYNVTLASYS